eukprot:CAMPEP_0204826916 /NCGR_PEP_ID=MMETSP1346-20131115/4507_1 /ASSEMBLY_ACC=CAM_ASM_000771 /TAXON_ID=215587 /ORGANISM="Aplanochytrium stocchinoi, Strain GSBS06" /LENGTH=1496 /DNA_ID=CAMNT_0051955151 /DNA_START=280 /DNA_END=4770 /DNA_ORIENTATION=+
MKKRTYEQPYVKLWFLVEISVPVMGYLVPTSSFRFKTEQNHAELLFVVIKNNRTKELADHSSDDNSDLTGFWQVQVLMAVLLFALSFKWVRTIKWPWELGCGSDVGGSIGLERGNKPPTTSPMLSTNWFMRATCTWVFPLVWEAYKKGRLEFDDLPENPDSNIQEAKYKQFQSSLKENLKKNGKKASLLRVCWNVWYREFFYLLVPLTVDLAFVFLNKFMFQWTLEYIENKNPEDSDRTLEFVCGYAMILFFSILTETLLWFEINRVKLQIRFTWTNAIYSKSLRLSQRACLEMTKGKVQNLISTDVESILDALDFLFYSTFTLFINIAVSCAALWHLVGVAFLPSLIVVFVVMVATFMLANISRYYSKEASNVSDKRLKLTTEVIKSISVVKSLGWTETVIAWISEVRNEEMRLVRKRMIWGLLEASINFVSPNTITFVTISLYVLARNQMSLAVVFAAGNWLNSLRNNLQGIPRLYRCIVHANVSFERIHEMLVSEELQENISTRPERNPNSIVEFDHATLSWYSQYKLESEKPESHSCYDNLLSRYFWNTTSTSRDHLSSLALPLLANGEKNPDKRLSREDELKALSTREDIIIHEKSESSCSFAKFGRCCIALNDEDGPVVIQKTSVLSGVGISNQEKSTPNRKKNLIQKSKLNIVIGKVGTGKSSLVAALTRGDVEVSAGSIVVKTPRGVALSSQVPWLKTGTIRENVLFGSEFEPKTYQEVLRVCQLQEDLKKLPKLDLTEIGEKGTKLSGGQQARVAMARAVYRGSTVDMFVFDDTLSALDANVSNKVFHDLLSSTSGILRETTRVLVTHDQRWLMEADNVIYVKDGGIAFSGTLEELAAYKAADEFINSMLEKDSNRLIAKENDSNAENATAEVVNNNDMVLLHEEEKEDDAEEEKTGSVSKRIYLRYLKKMGYCTIPLAFLMIGALIALSNAQNLWLAHWMKKEKEEHLNRTYDGKDKYTDQLDIKYYIIIYGILLIAYAVIDFMLWLVMVIGGYLAGLRMHDELVKSVIRAPMDFFWKNHSGKIINRFSSDLESVQDELYFSILYMFYSTEWALTCIFPIVILTPWSLSVILPLWITLYTANTIYRYAERDLQRMKKTKNSPIFLYFTESLEGASTIRSYKVENQFLQKCSDLLTDRNRVSFYYCSVLRFSIGNLQYLGAVGIVLCIIMVLSEEKAGNLRPEFAAVLLMYALNIQGAMNWFIRCMTDLEVEMVSTERLFTYIDEKPEDDTKPATHPDSLWPRAGEIQMKGIRFKYSGSDNVSLGIGEQGLSLTIKPGEKFAFVGRTGSGKSTMFKAILRFRDCFEGSILIDNVDTATVSHDLLRSRMSCVTQENVLFSTTLRKNLDPGASYDDVQIWNVLEKVGLKDRVMNCNGNLEMEISSGEGDLFSLGERQLISLARALLRNTRILLLDEATAAIDVLADKTIQDVVAGLEGITILSIAHRLSTIVGFDRVAVLSDGELIECGSPKMLLKDKDSAFYALANAH